MQLFQHETYGDYVEAQEKSNNRKLSKVFAKYETCQAIAKHFNVCAWPGFNLTTDFSGKQCLCHGVRNAKEMRWFEELLPGIKTVGTEIASTASNYPGVVQWDFQEERQDWNEAFDFVYSNSFDHSYDPVKALKVWKDQLKKYGWLYNEWTERHNDSGEKACINPADCYAATLEEYAAVHVSVFGAECVSIFPVLTENRETFVFACQA